MVRITVRIRSSVWLVSCYEHVFVRLWVVIVTDRYNIRSGNGRHTAIDTGTERKAHDWGRVLFCSSSLVCVLRLLMFAEVCYDIYDSILYRV